MEDPASSTRVPQGWDDVSFWREREPLRTALALLELDMRKSTWVSTVKKRISDPGDAVFKLENTVCSSRFS
jgi:hypothetical protein